MQENHDPTAEVDAGAFEPIIELTERVQPKTAEEPTVIDLTERVQPKASDISPAIDLIEPVLSPPDPVSSPTEPFPPEAVATLEKAVVLDDEISEDMDLEPDDFVDSLGMEIPAVGEAGTTPDETAAPIGGPLQANNENPEAAEGDAPPALTPEKIEATLERVVERIYAEKIEGILVEVIERVVTREIERLKGLLTGEDISSD